MANDTIYNAMIIFMLVLAVGAICLTIATAVVAVYDPFPATDEQCQKFDGTHEHIQRWCTCDTKWWGEPINKSYTACVAKPAGEVK